MKKLTKETQGESILKDKKVDRKNVWKERPEKSEKKK